MSSASMYSQDSWKTASPSVSVFVVEVDPTTASSPADTVQLSSCIEEDHRDSEKGFITSKSQSSVTSILTTPRERDVSSLSKVKEDNDTRSSHSKSDDDVLPLLANKPVRNSVRNLVDVGSLRTLGRRLSKIKLQSSKVDQDNKTKHSRSSKAIRKVMNRLSFLPSKREPAQL